MTAASLALPDRLLHTFSKPEGAVFCSTRIFITSFNLHWFYIDLLYQCPCSVHFLMIDQERGCSYWAEILPKAWRVIRCFVQDLTKAWWGTSWVIVWNPWYVISSFEEPSRFRNELQFSWKRTHINDFWLVCCSKCGSLAKFSIDVWSFLHTAT